MGRWLSTECILVSSGQRFQSGQNSNEKNCCITIVHIWTKVARKVRPNEVPEGSMPILGGIQYSSKEWASLAVVPKGSRKREQQIDCK